MAAITSEMIKELRERAGAGMLDCKKALAETEGDMEAAIDWLRKKGLAAAAKKSGRAACEGVVTIKINESFNKATMTEVNCETDFVAKNENFTGFAEEVADHIFTVNPSDIDALNTTNINGVQFTEHVQTTIGRIGENIVVRRFTSIETSANGVVNGYIHGGGKIGVIVAAACDSQATADAIRDVLKDIAMHGAAMNPPYLDDTSIPQADIDRELDVAKAQLEKEGKPQAMWDKILPGKVVKFKKDNCLVDQPFVKDDKRTVAQVLTDAAKVAGGTAKLVDYVRFEMGEGLEKASCDFASEVAAQLAKN